MKQELTNRINSLLEAETLKMARLSREMKEKGYDIISLSIGEPDFETPEYICQAATEAMNDGYTHYTPVPGYQDLRQAIADKLRRENGLDYGPENIIVSTGAKQSLMNLVLALVEEGHEVVLPAPYWVSYPMMVQFAGGKIVEVPTTVENDFKITPEQLEEVLNERTRMFIFSSPCNPSGSVYSEEELKGLAEVFQRYPEVFVVSDEIYEHINFTGRHHSIAGIEGMKEQVGVVNGVSKGFAMTGWRIGYLAGPEWVVRGCTKLQGQFTSGANSIAQRATLAALTGNHTETNKMRESFHRRRDLVVKRLQEMPGIVTNTPEGAFYVFPKVSSYYGTQCEGEEINSSSDFCMFMLKEAKVALVPGGSFGAEEYIRISYAASEEELEEGLNRIAKALESLK